MADAPFGANLKSKDYILSGVPVVQGRNIQNNNFQWNNPLYVSQEKKEELKKHLCKPGDLVFPKVGTIGGCAILPKIEGKDEFVLSTNMMKINVDKTKHSIKYIYYYFSNPIIQNTIRQYSASSVQPVFNFTSLKKFPVSIPSIEVQNAIASILSSLDDKIELNNAINKNLEEMAQALFKHWFVDFEFPNENGEPYKSSGGEFEESELRLIPKGWRVGTLSDLGEVVGGATPSKSKEEYYTSRGIPWITPKDLSINKNKYISRGQIDITKEGFKSSSTRLVPKGTVLFSSRAPIGYISISKNEMTTNQGFKSLIPFKNIGSEFLYYVLKFNTETIESRASGSTFKEISGSEMKRVPVIIPSFEVVKQFNIIVDSIGKMVEKCESESDSLIQLRNSLLPKLMSGEIRVPLKQENSYFQTFYQPMAAEKKAQYSTT